MHDLLGFQTHELGDRLWWKWVYEQNDSANDRPEVGINKSDVLAKGLVENPIVERIEGLVLQQLRLPFMGCVLWEADDRFELVIREEKLIVEELDSRDGVDKETPCPVTQCIEVIVARPCRDLA